MPSCSLRRVAAVDEHAPGAARRAVDAARQLVGDRAGDGLLAEEHARHADTITYELVSRIEARLERAVRRVVDA
jgi:hypothetical protein